MLLKKQKNNLINNFNIFIKFKLKNMNKSFEVDKYFYPAYLISIWIDDFAEVSVISFDNDILIIEWNNEEDIDNIFNEFINYVTWLINEL